MTGFPTTTVHPPSGETLLLQFGACLLSMFSYLFCFSTRFISSMSNYFYLLSNFLLPSQKLSSGSSVLSSDNGNISTVKKKQYTHLNYLHPVPLICTAGSRLWNRVGETWVWKLECDSISCQWGDSSIQNQSAISLHSGWHVEYCLQQGEEGLCLGRSHLIVIANKHVDKINLSDCTDKCWSSACVSAITVRCNKISNCLQRNLQ